MPKRMKTNVSVFVLFRVNHSVFPLHHVLNHGLMTYTIVVAAVPDPAPASNGRMSMFFFRLHNLRREEENKKKQRDVQRQRQRRGAKVFRGVNDYDSHLTLAPSRLFERTPMNPSDSLDEIALQIPR